MVHANDNSNPSAPTSEDQLEADARLKEIRRSVLSSCNLLEDSHDDPNYGAHCAEPPAKDVCKDYAHGADPPSKKVCKEEGSPKQDIANGAAVKQDGTARRVATIKAVLAETEALEETRDLRVATLRTRGVSASIKRYLLPSGEEASNQGALNVGVGTTKLVSHRTNALLAGSMRSLPGAFSCDGIASAEMATEETSESGSLVGDIESPSPRPPLEDLHEENADANGNGTLTVATKITEEDPMLPKAQEVNLEMAAETRRESIKRQQESKCNLVKATTFSLIFLLAVTGVVLLSVMVQTTSEDNDSTEAEGLPDHEPALPEDSLNHETQSPEDNLLSLLPELTRNAIDKEQNSPQTKAFEWMLQDPNLADLPDSRQVQRFALATLFYSTNSPSGGWFEHDNWLSHDVHECEWYNYNTHGFYNIPENEEGLFYNVTNATAPCSKNGVYEHLWLLHNGLEGSLPEEFYLLTSLKSISLDRNQLQGSLSTHIGSLTNLEALALYTNEMTGSLPTQLGLLTNLEYFWLMANEWTGSIPTELGLLSDSLVYLLVDNCQLTGHFPSEVGELSNLQWLWLYRNHLTGTLPTEMGLLGTVNSLAIDFNPFEGPIPTEVGGMTNVWTFHVEQSFISGTIPTELALCTHLDSLVFSHTLISGTIPTEIGLMNLGRRLWGYHTLLTGTLPTELGLLTLNAEMDLSQNRLTGTLPSEIGNMESVWRVHLSKNQLTSTVPTEFGQLQNLWTLHLNQNQLTGPIPSELGALDSMVTFWDESSNQTVEYWNITDIQLESNQFSGSLPSSLGLLKDLATLSIHNNSDLTGQIPSSFCDGIMGEEHGLVFSVDCALVECNCTVCSCV